MGHRVFNQKSRVGRGWLIGLALLLAAAVQATPVLVKDIQSGSGAAYPSSLVAADSTMFFAANDGTHGYELWRSDGTTGGTNLVLDTGTANFFLEELVVFGGKVFYRGNLNGDGFGSELWCSDGSATGTARVLDICPGSCESLPNAITVAGQRLLFSADDGTSGPALWSSDGTAGGTQKILGDAEIPGAFRPLGTQTLFSGGGSNPGLWNFQNLSDTASFLHPVRMGSASISLPHEAVYNGQLYFAGSYGGELELWRSDGTVTGTALVKDILPGSGSGYPGPLVELNGRLFFFANLTTTGFELWTSDGTEVGTQMLQDLRPGTIGSKVGGVGIRNMETLNGFAYFPADDGSGHGGELYRSDGTVGGTQRFVDICPGLCSSNPSSFFRVGSHIYFLANTGQTGHELWRTDGTLAGTGIVGEIRPGLAGPNIGDMVAFQGRLYFRANDGVNGDELWMDDPSDPLPTPTITLTFSASPTITPTRTMTATRTATLVPVATTCGTRTYTQTGQGLALALDGAGGAVVAGKYWGSPAATFLSRVDGVVQPQWTLTGTAVASQEFRGVVVQGSALLAGGMQSTSVLLLERRGMDGSMIWSRSWTAGTFSTMNALASDATTVAMVGRASEEGIIRFRVVVHDLDGNLLWTKAHIPADSFSAELRSAAYDACGILWTVGAESTGSDKKIHVLGFDKQGALVQSWNRAPGGTPVATGLTVDASGRIHIVYYNDACCGFPSKLLRYGPSGVLELELSLPGMRPMHVAADREGGSIVAGQCGFLPCVLRISPAGQPHWDWYGTSNGVVTSVGVVPGGDIFISGTYAPAGDGEKPFVQKLCQPPLSDPGLSNICASPTPTISMSFTQTPTGSPTATMTATPTASETFSITPTWSPSNSPTHTLTPSVTLSVTPSVTFSPTQLPTYTATPTQTPDFIPGTTGEARLGPVPVRRGAALCLHLDEAPVASQWRVFNAAGERVAELSFGSEGRPCAETQALASGLYWVRMKVEFRSGRSHTWTQKVVVVP